MALSDEVQGRVNAQLLRELTRHGQTSPTSVDTTILGYACTDAAAEFGVLVGVDYDNTNAEHVAAAIDGVLYYLHRYTGLQGEALRNHREAWERNCRRLAFTRGSRRRIAPFTDSVLEPSTKRSGARPFDDPTRWTDYKIDAPTSEGVDDLVDQDDT